MYVVCVYIIVYDRTDAGRVVCYRPPTLLLLLKKIIIIGASLSEPHTSRNGGVCAWMGRTHLLIKMSSSESDQQRESRLAKRWEAYRRWRDSETREQWQQRLLRRRQQRTTCQAKVKILTTNKEIKDATFNDEQLQRYYLQAMIWNWLKSYWALVHLICVLITTIQLLMLI